MRTTATLLAAALMLALGTHTAIAASEGDMAPADKASNQLYWDGQASLKKGDWNAALKHFQDLEKLLRAKEPQSADAALYWEAYTLVQAKRTAEAKTTLEKLRREFPNSRWSKDAESLLPQSRPATATVNTTSAEDEELADIAVEGLMNAPPERALPLLKKVLQSNHSTKVKKRALFVLSQLGTDDGARRRHRSREELARSGAARAKRSACSASAARIARSNGCARSTRSSKDAHEKRQIIEAWLVADRKDLVLASARNEPDPSVRAKAIETLGALDASAELKQLFDVTTGCRQPARDHPGARRRRQWRCAGPDRGRCEAARGDAHRPRCSRSASPVRTTSSCSSTSRRTRSDARCDAAGPHRRRRFRLRCSSSIARRRASRRRRRCCAR